MGLIGREKAGGNVHTRTLNLYFEDCSYLRSLKARILDLQFKYCPDYLGEIWISKTRLYLETIEMNSFSVNTYYCVIEFNFLFTFRSADYKNNDFIHNTKSFQSVHTNYLNSSSANLNRSFIIK